MRPIVQMRFNVALLGNKYRCSDWLYEIEVIVKIKLKIIYNINMLMPQCSDLEGWCLKIGKRRGSMMRRLKPEPDNLPDPQLSILM